MSEELSTRKKLTLAFAKLKREAARAGKKTGPSIRAVALHVGVSNANIHNNYPDIAEAIRNESGRGPKQQVEKQRTLTKQAEDRASELRADYASLKTENTGLASENARLILLVRSLEEKVAAVEAGAKVLRPASRTR
jgi:hypothetical protein